MANRFEQTFTHQLIGDHIISAERLAASDDQSNRRDFVRATFSAIEGLLWRLKLSIAKSPTIVQSLSIHERAALHEESYSVDHRGKVSPQPRYLPLAISIRLIVDVVQRFRPEYKLDLEHPGWQSLRKAIEVRNRIVHPKELSELTVTDDEIRDCHAGFSWFLAFVIEVMGEHVDHLEGLAPASKRKLDV